MTTYKRIMAISKTAEILKHLAAQKEPVSAPDVATAVNLPLGTTMCHLTTQTDIGWVQQIGDRWKLGMGLALIYARVKSNLEAERSRIDSTISELENGGE